MYISENNFIRHNQYTVIWRSSKDRQKLSRFEGMFTCIHKRRSNETRDTPFRESWTPRCFFSPCVSLKWSITKQPRGVSMLCTCCIQHTRLLMSSLKSDCNHCFTLSDAVIQFPPRLSGEHDFSSPQLINCNTCCRCCRYLFSNVSQTKMMEVRCSSHKNKASHWM